MYRVLLIVDKIVRNSEREIYDVSESGEFVKEELFPPQELPQIVKETLLFLKKQREARVFSQYGYDGLDDVIRYAELEKAGIEEGTEAQDLLKWRDEYDNKVWAFVDSLSAKNQEEIEELAKDLFAVEEELFNLTKTLLP